MHLQWFGQSAFLLRNAEGAAIAIDPFGDLTAATSGRLRFDYPPVEVPAADLLLITHEHADHNAAERIGGAPQAIRSTAGRFESKFGEVVAIASEHDDAAGTERGPNTIFSFSFDGLRICHFGDFGQAALRAAQRAAIGTTDVLLLPVGGGPTLGGEAASAIVRELSPRLVVPMHYRTDSIDFLEPVDGFVTALNARTERLEVSSADIDEFLGFAGEPTLVIFAAPA